MDLALAVVAETGKGELWQHECPSTSRRLGFSQCELAALPPKAAADGEGPVLQIDVVPAQTQRLLAAKAESEDDREARLQPITPDGL